MCWEEQGEKTGDQVCAWMYVTEDSGWRWVLELWKGRRAGGQDRLLCFILLVCYITS